MDNNHFRNRILWFYSIIHFSKIFRLHSISMANLIKKKINILDFWYFKIFSLQQIYFEFSIQKKFLMFNKSYTMRILLIHVIVIQLLLVLQWWRPHGRQRDGPVVLCGAQHRSATDPQNEARVWLRPVRGPRSHLWGQRSSESSNNYILKLY